MQQPYDFIASAVANKVEKLIDARLDDIIQRHLDNFIGNSTLSINDASSQKEEDMKRIKQRVNIGGQQRWITANSINDMLSMYLNLCISEGIVVQPKAVKQIPMFGDYLVSFLSTFKNKQSNTTMVNRDRVVKNHILPKFGSTLVTDITVTSIQAWFDELGQKYSKETIQKIRHIMSPALDSAIEDGFIDKNPMKSSRLVVGGKETQHHKAIPSQLMENLRSIIQTFPERQRRMAALLSYTGMRFEQVLGLRWQDIDDDWVRIDRAVVHPTRNKPQVKAPKTKTSKRKIPVPKEFFQKLGTRQQTGFVLWSTSGQPGEIPLSYTEARRSFKKITSSCGLDEYSAHDFRDTCATEWRERGLSPDIISRMLGHSKTDITEQRYVKYRDQIFDGIRDVL